MPHFSLERVLGVPQCSQHRYRLVHGKCIPDKLDDVTPLRFDVKIDDSHKILGVVIDSQMNYESHIDELCKKLSKRIGLLKHISPFLKQRQRETYYNCVINPTLRYGSMIWDSCNVEHLQSIKNLHRQSYYSIIQTGSILLNNL